jgi:hypothetical protein
LKEYISTRILRPILELLGKGADPGKLSLAATLGALIGVIPVPGISTGLAFAAGLAFRLNHVVLQALNYAVYPLQIILFPIFLKLGGILLGGDVMEFDAGMMGNELKASVPGFLSKYGWISLKSIGVWFLFSLLIGIPLRYLLKNFFERLRKPEGGPG